MSGTPIMPYQKIANGTLQEFRFASTGRVIDLDEYAPYTDAQLTNIPDIKPTDTLNTAVKILDGKIRALDRDKAEDGDLSAVAKSGDYDDLTNKPYIPVKVSDLTNDTGYITGVSWDDVSDKPASFTPADHTHKTSDINSLSGYVKAASAAEITAADSLNVALGKIQKTLDAKQNSADVIAEADKATKDGSGNVITTTYATKDEVSAIPKFKIQVVNSLPATGDAATVYLVKTGDESGNLYTEYIYVNNKWEELGTQALDLSGYALKSELPVDVSELNNDAGYLTAGDKINSATNADNATKATKDSSGQTITETYVKGLSVSGRTITITKGDDTTSTIQTQDTTYGAATSNKLGLVMTGANITNTNGILSLTQSNVTSALGYTPPTQDTTYGLATQTESGLMSNTDKVRLDNIEDNANNYVHPTSGATAGSYGPTANVTGTNNTTINVPQITIDANGHVTGVTNRVYTSKDTTYSAMTAAEATTGTATTGRLITAKVLHDKIGEVADAKIADIDTGVMSVTTGSANGTLSVDGTDVAVKGLASGAYAAAYVHPTSGVTADTYGPTANVTGTNNTTLTVPEITVDANGHITGVTERTYTSKDTTYGAGTTALLNTGTDTSNRVWPAKQIADYVTGKIGAVDTGVMSVTTGTTNGTISVDGTDVDVKGLGSAAYTASTAYAAASHNQASNTIDAMTDYAKPSSTSAIATTDTLNSAIGKLEKALDGKQASLTAMTAAEATTGTATTARSITAKVLHDKIKAVADASAAAVDTGVMSVTTGSANGTLSVDGTDVAVKGLGSAAYTASTAYAPASHNQASNTIDAMTGYSKPSATSAIATSDTLNAAIGKLEKALDGKQASLSAMTAAEATTGTATTARSITAKVLHDKIAAVADAKIADIDTGVMSVTTGETNGTLSVDGTDVAVKGLASGAYADAYVHPTTAGNKHIPSGGSSGQILKYSSSGTAVWANEYSYTHPTTAGNKHIPTGGATGNVLKYGGSSGTAAWGTLTASDVGALASDGTAVRATADASGNNIATTYATKNEVSAIPKFKIEVVTSLPTTGEAATIYLVNTGDESGNLYTEYIYVNNAWEKLGTQTLDLSGYALKSDITTGSTNGTIAVDGTDVAVKGLASGAYAAAYVHPTTAGNKHIPSGGASGQILKYSSSGTAVWANEYSYTHPASGVTADTYGPTANVTGTNNTTLTVPEITVDANGHITGVTERTYTSKDTTYSAMTAAEATTGTATTARSITAKVLHDKIGEVADAKIAAIDTGVMSVTTGSANGTLSVDGTDVAVKGLGSAAYTASTAYAPASHNQASNTIDAMTGYSKPSSTSAIATTDTLNAAIGKLEKALDGKQASLSAMTASEATTGTATTARSITAKVLHDKIKEVADASAAAIDTGVMSVTTGSTNGTLSVDGTDVAVKGLASGAYAAAYSHPTTAGNKHIPTGGATGNVLKYGGSSGTASWATLTAADVGALASNGTAVKATADASGNTITTTYATKDELGNVNKNTSRSVEYIVGTQTAATPSFTGISEDSELYDGKCINYYLPYAGTSAGDTLNLTLSDGTTTGAKQIYLIGTTKLTTHFGAGQVFMMTYSATKNAWYCGNYDSNSNTYDRMLHNNNIKAATAITAGTIIVGTSAGYKKAESGVTFDITYPILYASAAIAASAVNKYTYDIMPGVNMATTKSGWTGTQYATAYLVGTLSGVTFTIDSAVFTTTAPVSNDGKVYIPLGVMDTTTAIFFNPSKEIYQYTNRSFHKLDTTTAATGSANGTIAINGTDVAVKGLASGAYATAYSHPNSGVTADTYGPTANVTGTNNTTLIVPEITVNAQGHITGVTERTYTSKDTTYSAGTTALLNTGTDTTNRVWPAKQIADYVTSYVGGEISGIDTGVMSVTTGGANGTISVDGEDVAIKGLASGAYADAYVHPTTAGNKHIPSGGSTGQILRWSAAGTAAWGAENNTTYTGSNGITLTGTNFTNSGVRSIATGTANGTISVNTNGTAADVAVKGLASGAYADAYEHPNSGATAGSYGPSANASPAHGAGFSVPYVTINAQGHVTAASTKTITLPAQYVHPTGAGNNHIPSGGSSGQFLKWSSSGVAVWAADNNTLNTAGSTDTSSKIFLIGATSQAANPQTYSDNEVYVTSGVLTTKSVQVGGTACTLQYNATNKCVDFVFA